jgi:bifunctional ADP-heptose synthase (sugar kinase/adenylyltransferase)
VELVLATVGRLRIGVLGDLFLDRYLDIDAALTEPSLETGLDAYQVTRVRPSPGAAGTVVNNLVALGVGTVLPLAVIGDDGEGYELRQALGKLRGLDARGVLVSRSRRTPTYTKPMLHEPGRPPRELNRLDIQNRSPLPDADERALLDVLENAWPALDGLVVLDQVSLAECGVVTCTIRDRTAALAARTPSRPILGDSRARIGLFRTVCLKPNQRECLAAGEESDLPAAVMGLCRKADAPVFCTRGESGILLAEPGQDRPCEIAGFPVTGPTDPVGAGDSTSAGIICALAG